MRPVAAASWTRQHDDYPTGRAGNDRPPRFQYRGGPDLRCPRRVCDEACARGRGTDSRVLPRRPLRYPRRVVVANRNWMADLPNPAPAARHSEYIATSPRLLRGLGASCRRAEEAY